jgi:aminoglycoside/choline kinase family phosphotransferase
MSGDAGFRCYYRFSHQGKSFIAVDAPIDMSDNPAFVFMQKLLSQQDILVPEIIAVDLSLGFFCLSDFGNVLLSDTLALENMSSVYQNAIDILPKIHLGLRSADKKVAHYDQAFVKRELDIFTEWLIEKHLSITLSESEQLQLNACFDVLNKNMLEQPQVLIHRDFHSRNIMVVENGELGVIDFQDAVIGPVTYDIVSLLRDCYIKWPQIKVADLLQYYIELISAQQPALANKTLAQWQRWFDLTGMQRHLKASGIFARLHHRDGKSGYLNDIPLTLSYLLDISKQYDEFNFLHQLLTTKVLPAMEDKRLETCLTNTDQSN